MRRYFKDSEVIYLHLFTDYFMKICSLIGTNTVGYMTHDFFKILSIGHVSCTRQLQLNVAFSVLFSFVIAAYL